MIIDFGQYEVVDLVPRAFHKPLRPSQHANPEEFRAYADALEEYQKNQAAYNEAREQWRNTRNELQKQFKHDALVDVKLMSEDGKVIHHMANKAYSMAWERCHSEGLKAVYDELCELASLMRSNHALKA